MPINPSAASFDSNSRGNCCASSHSRTYGRSSDSANSRTLCRNSCCSEVKSKSILVIDRIIRLMRLLRVLPLVVLLLAASARAALADGTLFLGTSNVSSADNASRQTTKGFAIGAGVVVVGVEFEYASTGEDEERLSPSMRTGMGNVYVQTPIAIAG